MHTSRRKIPESTSAGWRTDELDGQGSYPASGVGGRSDSFPFHFVLFPTASFLSGEGFSTQIVLNEDRKEGTQSHVICMGRVRPLGRPTQKIQETANLAEFESKPLYAANKRECLHVAFCVLTESTLRSWRSREQHCVRRTESHPQSSLLFSRRCQSTLRWLLNKPTPLSVVQSQALSRTCPPVSGKPRFFRECSPISYSFTALTSKAQQRDGSKAESSTNDKSDLQSEELRYESNR
jgi:hypothetical protein